MAWLAITAVERHIDMHRQVIDFSSCLGYLLHVGRISPRLENLLGIDVITKQLRPVGTSLSLGLQLLLQIGVQRLLILLQIVGQLLWHSTLVHPCSISRIVTRHLNHTNLILYLHHNDRLLLGIMIAQMLHDTTEGTLVCLQHILAERRSLLYRFAFGCMSSRESLQVTLEPLGRIATHRVLPCAKPQQYDFQFVEPCLVQDGVE